MRNLRTFLSFFSLFQVVILIPILTVGISSTNAWGASVDRGPYLQLGTPTSIVVMWRTDEATDSIVYYGSAPDDLTIGNVYLPALTTEHEITLTGLTADTMYYYSIGSSSETLAGGDNDHYFVTSPSYGTAKPTRIWVIGDSGAAGTDAEAVRDAYISFTGTTSTDVWLMLGDNAYPSGTDIQYQLALFDMYPTLLRNTVVWPTLGNHDSEPNGISSSTGTGPYFDMFTLPSGGEAGGTASGTEAYYSFDYGNVHFINLNTTDPDPLSVGDMLTWLQIDLSNNNQDWIIAFFHHPPYTKGSHDSDVCVAEGGDFAMCDIRENALPILEGGGVDLVLTGHSHSYERSMLIDSFYTTPTLIGDGVIKDPGDGRIGGDGAYSKTNIGPAPYEGAVYAVAGSSAKISGGALNHPVMHISLSVLGSMVLDVNSAQLDARFIDNNGLILDSFTIVKGGTVANPPALPQDGIMDNNTQWTLSTGNWFISSGADPYGANSFYSSESGATFEYIASGVNGEKEVSLWWTYWSNRCTSVPVDIYDGAELLATVNVDHLQNGGQWNSLGTYTFSGTARVVINSLGGCTTSADAVKIDSPPTPPALPQDGIMDNDTQWTSSTGSWLVSGGANPYGANSLYSNTSATYTYEASGVNGEKEVSLWWTYWSNRCTSVPVDIYDGAQLLATVNVDHLQNGGQWNSLGTYTFNSGTARVIVNSLGGCTTSADAVKIADPSAGVTITESGGMTDVAEEGVTSDDYTVVLTSAPTGDVVVTVTSQDTTTGVTVDFASLTFGTGTWSVPQTVTVTAVDDALVEGAHSTQIDHVIDQVLTQDPEYDAVTGISSVTANITDNDSGGPPALPQDGIMDNDTQWTTSTGSWLVSIGANPYGVDSLYANTSATYTYEASGVNGEKEVSLWWTYWSNRCASVPVDIYDGAELLATVNVDHLQNSGQWNSLGTYTFNSGNARVVINSQGGCTTSADAVKIDTPSAGVTITESGGTTDVAEEGVTSDDYTVVLTSAPTGDVVVTVTSQDTTTGVTVDFAILTFGTGTWSVPQTVTVTAVDDAVVEGAHSTQIDHVIDQVLTQDPEYDAVTGISSVTANITDNDGGGPPALPGDGIMDNDTQWTSSTGSWLVSIGANPYGANSLYSNTSATYTYEASGVNGEKEVSLWWTFWSNRCTSVPVDIYDGAQLLATVNVDHLQNGGQWNSLGTYTFNSGTARVVINSLGGCTTSADAVKIDVPSTPPALPGDGIMDNDTQWTSSTGSWLVSIGANPYGANSLYSNTSATYTYEASGVNGEKEVSLWWTFWSNRCTSVPVDIYDGAQLLATVNVDHLQNGGQWNSLGTWSFTGTARVVIRSQGVCSTSADAVKIDAPLPSVNLVAAGAIWKYLDDGSDQGIAWKGSSFDDALWSAGNAELGYGDGDETTVVSFGPDPNNKYTTTYFRHSFNVADAASISNLTLRILRDDGAVVYLNGTEIYRTNMPAGPITYATFASGNTPDENAVFMNSVDPGLLIDGNNILAVEIHQANFTSSDISFDLELINFL